MGSSKDDSATDADNSGGNLPASNSSIFSEGEKVLAYHGPRIYEAKKVGSYDPRSDPRDLLTDPTRILILTTLLSKFWDEWVGMDRLMELTEDNVLKQQALDKKQGVDKNSKSGRSAQTKPKASSEAKVDKEDTKNNGREIFFSLKRQKVSLVRISYMTGLTGWIAGSLVQVASLGSVAKGKKRKIDSGVEYCYHFENEQVLLL
ncbi:hypothetical protein HYC85_002576 [Camellia sinensis]|uniref:Uncharacterized protein n=1 Tax=Camellia sinensis TaxID=4442 RepID=A0A7J7I9Z9_CAMSI|nr:hypothetical protein HYC85_002576 [Camellia sinensis]